MSNLAVKCHYLNINNLRHTKGQNGRKEKEKYMINCVVRQRAQGPHNKSTQLQRAAAKKKQLTKGVAIHTIYELCMLHLFLAGLGRAPWGV